MQLLPEASATYQDAPTWSPDGAWVAFTYLDRTGKWSLGKIRPGAGGAHVVIREGITFPSSPQWSPDGRWIMCELRDGLYARSPEGGAPRLISRESWLAHTWSRDGSQILAMRETDDNRLQLASIDLQTQSTRILARDLGPSPPTTPPLRGFSLSLDGTHMLTSLVRLRGDLHLLDGFGPPDRVWTRVSRAFGWRRTPRSSP